MNCNPEYIPSTADGKNIPACNVLYIYFCCGFGKLFKRKGLTNSKEVGAQIHNGLESEEKMMSLALLALFIYRDIIKTKNLVNTF